MEHDNRHAFGQNFQWNKEKGAWETIGSTTKVWVVPQSKHVNFWWIRTEPDSGVHRQYTGNTAEWQAFHDAAELSKKAAQVQSGIDAAATP